MSETQPDFVAKGALAGVGLIITIASAVPLTDKRLARVADIERELGSVGRLPHRLYIRPQRFYKFALIALTIAGVAAALAYVFADFDHPIAAFLRSSGSAILVIWLVLGMATYTNILSWFGIGLLYAVSALSPLRALLLRGRRVQDRADWAALLALVNYNESAKPVIVDFEAGKNLADFLLQQARQSPGAGEGNRAAPPDPLPADEDSRDRYGNALLVACAIEGAHSRPHSGMPARNWRPFYNVAREIAGADDSMFGPEKIRTAGDLSQLSRSILAEFNTRLLAAEPRLPDSDALRESVTACLKHLRDRYKSRTTTIAPRRSGLLRTRMEIIRRRVEAIPQLGGPGIRSLFVKLAIRWGVWDRIGPLSFQSGPAARIAALLLNRRVIAAIGEIKQFNLSRPEEKRVFRAASQAVVGEAVRLVAASPEAQSAWLPAAFKDALPETRAWIVADEIDYRLYDYSKRLAEGKIQGEEMTPWSVRDGQLIRA
jgi:hypothetical protein